MKLQELRQLIKEEISKAINEVNPSYKIISKETRKSEFGNKIHDKYTLDIKDEMYTTPEGLNFQLKTQGYVLTPEGEELDFNLPHHYFYYIQTYIMDKNGNKLEDIPGEKVHGQYNVAASLNKAKKWLNQRGSQLMAGKGFQHKST